MRLSKILIILFVTIGSIINCTVIYSQTTDKFIAQKDSFDLILDSIITKEYYINPNEKIKIIFALKIDSSGEILCAHIRKSINLNTDYYYNIWRELEYKLNAKFIYDHYKYRFLRHKYIEVMYPYRSPR